MTSEVRAKGSGAIGNRRAVQRLALAGILAVLSTGSFSFGYYLGHAYGWEEVAWLDVVPLEPPTRPQLRLWP